ncbi:MAG: HAMP domain-containing protein [Wenzhouxiangella sp.]|nr:MAG: HAMP domain-containing protein [Wenzhouxiangella sp.]
MVLINDQLERAQREDVELSQRAQRLAANLQTRAASALARGGREELARWAESGPQRGRRLTVFVFDAQGQELLDRPASRDVRRMTRQWLDENTVPMPERRGQFTAAVVDPDHGAFLIVLSPPPRPVFLRLFGPLGLGGLIVAAIMFSGLICLWLARTVSRPVQQLRLAGQALGQGNLSARAPDNACRRGDELGDLARDFNRMAERLQGLIDGQRQLLRDVSHELRSPLARIQVALALATDSPEEVQRADYLARIETDIERLNQLIGEILSFARISQDSEPEKVPMDLGELIADIGDAARLEGQPRRITIFSDCPERLPIRANEELLHRAIENVVRNALRHTPEGGQVKLVVRPDGTGQVEIRIEDQGPGVAGQRLADIFDPFVRLSPERGEGSSGGGIGLAIARAAIEQHHGSIEARNRPQGGLCIAIRLPIEGGQPPA